MDNTVEKIAESIDFLLKFNFLSKNTVSELEYYKKIFDEVVSCGE